jgi:hypothetical protein
MPANARLTDPATVLVPGERRCDGFLAAMLRNQRIRGWISHRHRHAVGRAYREEGPRHTGQAQEKGDEAADTDRRQIRALQADAIGGPSRERLQAHGHGAVQRREEANFRETESEMTSVER